MGKRFSPTHTEVSDMVKLYSDGKSLRSVADQFNVSVPTIRRALSQAGLTIRPRGRALRRHLEDSRMVLTGNLDG